MLALHLDSVHPEYSFDRVSKRYRYTSGASKGQFAPRAATLALTRQYVLERSRRLSRLGEELTTNRLTPKEFQRQAAIELKKIHVSQAILAANGADRVTPEQYLIVARRLKQQYYAGRDPLTGDRFGLRHLAEDYLKGGMTPAQLRNRLSMFAASGKGTYWAVTNSARRSQGMTKARRILGRAEHCRHCPQYAAMGWVNLSEVILPTEQCECRTRCKCSIEYR